MRTFRVLVAVAIAALLAPAARAQRAGAAAAPDALLDKMTGHWLLTGTIAKQHASNIAP